MYTERKEASTEGQAGRPLPEAGCSGSAGLRGRLCRLSGQISMPMYLFHWLVASLVPRLTSVLWARVLALLYTAAAAFLKHRFSKRRETI